ncbi:MAG: DUF1287 domain-containing protein [Actinobacteria bacterium]|nr:DUF1287 domain-containing protein [Actinomycetota bacterium]
MEKARKLQLRKSQSSKIIIFSVVILSVIQIWFLFSSYKEVITKIPADLFTSPRLFPESELIISSHYSPPEEEQASGQTNEEFLSSESILSETSETAAEYTAESTLESSEEFVLSDIQKKIVLRLMELLEEDITYGYKVYPETGYPTENIWVSTDVISVVYKDVGYDLMEIIHEDMKAHKEDYPMDIKRRSEPIKHIDFRDTYFQEKFFKRNALELDKQFVPDNKENKIQWQPGDIVYFQFDPDNPNLDLGGFISSRTNDQGVPLVIMISKEFGKVSEVDKLLEYTIIGHYRYPNPYEEE